MQAASELPGKWGTLRGERVAKADTWGCFRLPREHVQILIWISTFLGKFMGIYSMVGRLIYTQNIIDSIFLSNLKTIPMFVFNNKITSG